LCLMGMNVYNGMLYGGTLPMGEVSLREAFYLAGMARAMLRGVMVDWLLDAMGVIGWLLVVMDPRQRGDDNFSVEVLVMKRFALLVLVSLCVVHTVVFGVSDEGEVSAWMKEAPEDWRWDARIAHVKWYPQIIDFPEGREVIADHLAILKSYGFNTACLFGYHYRFDHTASWEKLEAFAAVVCEEGHRLGMKVIGHHSAVLSTPSHHDDKLRVGDALVRDLFPSSLTIGTPPGGAERAAFLCTNNPVHQAAYLGHIEKLMAAGLDGLMTDDLCWWPDPYACVCEHCRKINDLRIPLHMRNPRIPPPILRRLLHPRRHLPLIRHPENHRMYHT